MPEAAFLTCRFWLIDAWWWIGRRREARDLFVDALQHRNRYGLLAEDIHPQTGRIVGQFSANLLDGGTDFDGYALVAKLGGSVSARLILVSNRVSIPRTGGAQRAGGLEVALAPNPRKYFRLYRSAGAETWFQPTKSSPKRSSGREPLTSSPTCRRRTTRNTTTASPIGCCGELHYRIDLTEFTRRDLTGYFRVNQHFASELSKFLQPDDIVWVHDYQLIPIAEDLRQRGHANRIGFFLHVPFPAPEVMAVLPNHEQLLPLLLQYDLVGFKPKPTSGTLPATSLPSIDSRAAGFFEATDGQLVFSCGGRETRIGSFPVGIDTDEFERVARRAVKSPFVRDVVESLGNRALVIGVDRLDYSKGLIQRIEAFERFYALHSEWQGKVTYLQIAPRSRSEIPEYNELEQAVGAAAGRINGKYGEVASTPIRYLNRTYSRSGLAGLYRSAQAALVISASRWHEPGSQGVRRRARRRKSGSAYPVAVCRRRCRVRTGSAGEPIRSGFGRECDRACALYAAG